MIYLYRDPARLVFFSDKLDRRILISHKSHVNYLGSEHQFSQIQISWFGMKEMKDQAFRQTNFNQ